MKKEYTKPEMNVMELGTEVMMLGLSSSGDSGLEGTTPGGSMSGGEADANERRGSWGDLWR
jgi:hypothetical protein